MNNFTVLLIYILWIHFCISNHSHPPPPLKEGYGPSLDLEEDEEQCMLTALVT